MEGVGGNSRRVRHHREVMQPDRTQKRQNSKEISRLDFPRPTIARK